MVAPEDSDNHDVVDDDLGDDGVVDQDLGNLDAVEDEIKSDAKLRKLLLEHTWCQLAEAAKQDGGITDLDLMGTACVTEDECEDFANFLAEDYTFQALDISHCHLSSKFATIVGAGMCSNSSMKSFCIGGNALGDDCCEAMGKMLQSNRVLACVDLSGCEIREEGAKLLAAGLAGNKGALTQLDLGGNSIGDVGAEAFAEVLGTLHEGFRQLDLVHNHITEVGAHHLAEAVKQSKHLDRLRLNSNRIGDAGALHFAAAIRNNPKTCALDLCDNKITYMGKGYLEAASEAVGRPMDATNLQLNPMDLPKSESEAPRRPSATRMWGRRCGHVLRLVRCGRRWRPFVPLAEQVDGPTGTASRFPEPKAGAAA
mmetsp:Transcript_24227/g.41437  ORF Transcript_24227/g.41437 Transcript_24227/m.41437 type:complete len:369 (-) Transcript_24227:104-1210(-)